MYKIAIHGGAGTVDAALMTTELEAQYINGLSLALNAGADVLKKGGSAEDAVLASVMQLEDFPLFNAGRGAVFNHIGEHEMDAAIMLGKDLSAGAVCGVSGVKNPVLLAQAVMNQSNHVVLANKGAEAFAKELNFEKMPDSYFFTEQRHQQWLNLKNTDTYSLDHSKAPNKMGTVGAVALDVHGNLAASTSTGGMTNKKYGRIGDTPLFGAGTYANNKTCAISCTGHGELFIKAVVAYDVSCLMEYKGLSLKEACHIVVMDKLVKIQGEGGLIAIDHLGNIEMPFNSEGMYRASTDQNGSDYFAIYR